MTIWVGAKPGARSREVLVDEATAEQLQRDLTLALEGIRAAKRAVAGMLTPRGEHPYPPANPEAAVAVAESIAHAAPPAPQCPMTLDGEPCTVPGVHAWHYGADQGDGLRRMWQDDQADNAVIDEDVAAAAAQDGDEAPDDTAMSPDKAAAFPAVPFPPAEVLLLAAETDVALREPTRPMCTSGIRLPGTSYPIACTLNEGHDDTVHVSMPPRHHWTGSGETAVEVCGTCSLPLADHPADRGGAYPHCPSGVLATVSAIGGRAS